MHAKSERNYPCIVKLMREKQLNQNFNAENR